MTLFPVQKKGKTGYIDETGEVRIGFDYGFAGDFSEGLARVQLDSNGRKWAYIDETGRTAFNIHADTCCDFSEGLARIEMHGKIGYIDKSGRMAVKPRFAYDSESFHDGYAIVTDKQNPKGILIDRQGNVILKGEMLLLSEYREGLLNVPDSRGKWGYIDLDRKAVIRHRYNSACPFYEGVAAVGVYRDEISFIDLQGNRLFEKNFVGALPRFSQGLCPLMKPHGDYWGYIDRQGDDAIEFRFSYAGDFSEGMAVVKVRGEGYGFIDQTGKQVIPPVFAHAESFSNGLSEVRIKDKNGDMLAGYIDKTGGYVWEPSA